MFLVIRSIYSRPIVWLGHWAKINRHRPTDNEINGRGIVYWHTRPAYIKKTLLVFAFNSDITVGVSYQHFGGCRPYEWCVIAHVRRRRWNKTIGLLRHPFPLIIVFHWQLTLFHLLIDLNNEYVIVSAVSGAATARLTINWTICGCTRRMMSTGSVSWLWLMCSKRLTCEWHDKSHRSILPWTYVTPVTYSLTIIHSTESVSFYIIINASS